MEQDILDRLYYGKIVPWENRRGNTPAIGAPGRPEVHQNRLLRPQHLLLKIFFRDDDRFHYIHPFCLPFSFLLEIGFQAFAASTHAYL